MQIQTKEISSQSFVQSSVPPSNIEAEEAVLGGILLDPNAVRVVYDILEPDYFCVQSHQSIYRACAQLHLDGRITDLMSVANKLQDKGLLERIGGMAKLALLCQRTVTTANIKGHAQLIKEKWLRRDAIRIAQKITDAAYNGYLDTEGLFTLIEEEALGLTQAHSPKDDVDPHLWKYQQLVDDVREVELFNPQLGLRRYKMRKLAEKHKMPLRDLLDIYYCSILDQEGIESSLTLGDFLDNYGNDFTEWLLHGFFPKGSTSLLHAYGGVGKTRLAYDFIYHLCTGEPWNGFPVTNFKRNVLLVQTDESPGDTVEALQNRGIDQTFPLRITSKWTSDYIHMLEREIREHDIEFVVIDSLTSINRNSMFSENETEYARPILRLRDLAYQTGAHILILHHSNSEGKQRGTKAIFNSVSQVLGFHRVDDKDPANCDRTLIIEKSRSRRPTKYRLEFVPEEGRWICHGEENQLSDVPSPDATTKELIVDFLSRNRNRKFEVREIQEVIGGTINRVGLLCSKLKYDGIISRTRVSGHKQKFSYFLVGENGYTHPTDETIVSLQNNFDQDYEKPDRPDHDCKEMLREIQPDRPFTPPDQVGDQVPDQVSLDHTGQGIQNKPDRPDRPFHVFNNHQGSHKKPDRPIRFDERKIENHTQTGIDKPDRGNLIAPDRGGDQVDQVSPEINAGDTVLYSGNKASDLNVCRNYLLRVLKVSGKKIEVKADAWFVTRWLKIDEVKKADDRDI